MSVTNTGSKQSEPINPLAGSFLKQTLGSWYPQITEHGYTPCRVVNASDSVSFSESDDYTVSSLESSLESSPDKGKDVKRKKPSTSVGGRIVLKGDEIPMNPRSIYDNDALDYYSTYDYPSDNDDDDDYDENPDWWGDASDEETTHIPPPTSQRDGWMPSYELPLDALTRNAQRQLKKMRQREQSQNVRHVSYDESMPADPSYDDTMQADPSYDDSMQADPSYDESMPADPSDLTADQHASSDVPKSSTFPSWQGMPATFKILVIMSDMFPSVDIPDMPSMMSWNEQRELERAEEYLPYNTTVKRGKGTHSYSRRSQKSRSPVSQKSRSPVSRKSRHASTELPHDALTRDAQRQLKKMRQKSAMRGHHDTTPMIACM